MAGPIGPIARLPSGLLGFCDIRNDGQYPNRLQEAIQCNLDLMEFFSANAQEPIVESVNVTTIGGFGFTSSVQPGAGEYWWVRSAMLNSAVPATDNIRIAAMLGKSSGAGFVQSWAGEHGTTSLTDAVGVGSAVSGFPRDFLMSPGDRFLCSVQKITTAAFISVTLTAHIFRFR
jgi:hypothetical protein